MNTLVIAETHPVQYHAPVYRCLTQQFDVPVSVIYGSDFSLAGYRDTEFAANLSWEGNLLKGYASEFLHRSKTSAAIDYDHVSAAGLTAMLERLKPEAVLSLGYHHPFDKAGLRWCRQTVTPTLFRGETTDAAIRRGLLKRLLRDLFLRRLYQNCAALCYVGEASRRHYVRLGVPPGKLFFSPYCVDKTLFQTDGVTCQHLRQETRHKLGMGEDKKVILFSGKLSHRKGVDMIPEAVRLLPDSLRNSIHLLFLGDGVLRQSMEQSCMNGHIKIPATFTGFQNQSQLSPYYAAADMLCLPSREGETWGLVVNEALMHGVPCVVSEKVGCHPDLVTPGTTGEICQANDVHALSQALARGLDWCNQNGVFQRCQEREQHYSVQAAAEGLASAWNFIRQKKNGGGVCNAAQN